MRDRLQGGGLSIYDTEQVFFDRSYFAVKVGDERGTLEKRQEVVPRATIYNPSHQEFSRLVRIYDTLFSSFVAPDVKTLKGLGAYQWCCQALLSWASSTSQPDDKIEELRDELGSLQQT